MNYLFLLLALAPATLAAPKTDRTFFRSARGDIAAVLANKIFRDYGEYNIVNIRQGEMGESMAYFVRLEKPFQTGEKPLCFQFTSPGKHVWKLDTAPYPCKD